MNDRKIPVMIYHIAEQKDWLEAVAVGTYRTSSLKDEGFIHCSTVEQVMEVAERLFAARTDVVVLEISQQSLPVKVKYEVAPNGKTYPHIYGEIPLEAVRRVLAINWKNLTLEDLTNQAS
jgi:uncharacterized protein (DUF952 family)